MSLLAQVAAGVETAFTAAGDLVSSAQYVVRSGASTYDPVTDTHSTPTTTYTVRALRSSFTEQEREASPVTVEDVKILVPASDLDGTKPRETDYFQLDGLQYNVLAARGIPGNSLWIITGRKK